jgi:hypothetical protein
MSYYKNLDILNNKRKQLYLDIKNLSKDNRLLEHLNNTSNNIDSLLESLFEDEGDLEENKMLIQEMLEFHIASLKNLKDNLNTPVNEDIINGEIECGKCGWKWDLADGGQEPYLCHKCNYDNSDQIEEYDVENADDLREFIEFMESYQQELNEADCDCLLEAKYQGRTVPLGKPMRGDSKKFKVYVKNPKTGKVVKVNFGAKGMNIKKNNPVRRKAFRARHNCKNPGPRTKARYWSCRKW